MTDLKLDEDNDIAIEANNAVLISGADEVTQRLRCNLLTFLGEWFLDHGIGVPYFQTIFVKGISLDRVGAALKRVIITTPGVLELLEYDQSLDGSTRRLAVSFKARATDGEIIDFNEEIP